MNQTNQINHPVTLPVACRSLRTGARFGEELIGCRLFFQIRLVGAEHRYVYLFIRKGFVAGPEHTFPIQYLHGVEARDFEWKGLELVR